MSLDIATRLSRIKPLLHLHVSFSCCKGTQFTLINIHEFPPFFLSAIIHRPMPSNILAFGKEIISVVTGHTTIVPLTFFPREARSSVQRTGISKAM